MALFPVPGSLSSSPAQEPGNEATTAYVCAIRVTIFSTSGKFQPVSNFTELHALTLAARSYALLASIIHDERIIYPLICSVAGSTLRPLLEQRQNEGF